ncbi:DUF6161 domain-containing protein [Microbulbifer sp.]|uniref:DUF6161 domain-containing protein n=1 Tax=Microbulbifer sp. TaxID=1908541 RepID=UPI003F39174C
MSEENALDVKLKRITVKTESGTRWFRDADTFVHWANEQAKLLAFLRRTKNQHGEHHLLQRLQQPWQQLIQFARQQVKPLEGEEEKYAGQVDRLTEQFNQQLAEKQLFTGEAPFADFVVDRIEEQDYVTAAVAIAYFMEENLSNFDFSLAVGFQKTMDWVRGAFGKAESETQSLVRLRESWDEEFKRQAKNAEEAQEDINLLAGRAASFLEDQRKRFDERIDKFEGSLNETLVKAHDELVSITQTYEEDLALHAPVRYWGIQEKYHRRKMIIFACITGVATFVSIVGLISFSGYVLDQKVTEIVVGKIVTMGVLTTFAVWVVRLCANLFMSHSHLHTDAQERRTMIHTYLSLLRKRNALKEEERQLILQTLFRPNTTGMIKNDAGPAHLVDLLNRITPKGSN